ncbi:hypothetical protein OBBRIDRAFT_829891 [Obba rivulosa]|uniref:Uncharacterized protein n=1 Tax=Obba rivulosa TaxID=1052685 RepID=A0A8E2DVK2_9APHY|nr:hypothetical protein OBBRIDRAFT_829891 [Obba rivulosa]
MSSSTPFFPGAWPASVHSISQDDIPEVQTTRRNNGVGWCDTEQSAEKVLRQATVKNGQSPIAQHEPHEVGEHARSTQSPGCPRSPMSADFSLRSHMSEATVGLRECFPTSYWILTAYIHPKESSATTSDDVLTPDLVQSHVWPSPANPSRRLSRKNSAREHAPFSRFTSSPRPAGGVSTVPFPTSPHNSIHTPSPYLDPPLSSFPSDLPPIPLPLSSLSQQSLLSNDDTPPVPPTSPRSRTSSEMSFLSIESPEADVEELVVEPTRHDVSQIEGLLTVAPATPQDERHMVSSTASSYDMVPKGDSPVLPSENSLGLSEHRVMTHGGTMSPFSPASSADLDAFAMAAAAAAQRSQGSFSTPDSGHSAHSDTRLISDTPPSISACYDSRTSRSANATSLALAALSSTIPAIPQIHRSNYANKCPCGCEDWLDRASITEKHIRRRTAPALSDFASGRTISSRVDVGPSPNATPEVKGNRQGKALSKVKKFGGRLWNLLKTAKSGSEGFQSGEIGVKTTTTTAVTAVEYRPEQTISSPSSRAARTHRHSLPLPGHLATSTEPDRRQSFLPISSNDSKPRLSLPFQHARARTQPAEQGRRDSGLVASTLPATPVRTNRQRTRTAPGTLTDKENIPPDVRKSPGFSFSSAFSRSKLDILRNTVAPHPPLPPLPPIPPPVHHARGTSPGQKRESATERRSRERAARSRSVTAGGWAREDIHSWASELATLSRPRAPQESITVDSVDADITPSRARAMSQPLQTPPPSPPQVRTARRNSQPLLAQTETPTPVRPGRRARGFSLSSVMRLGAKVVSGSAEKRPNDSANAIASSHDSSPADCRGEPITGRGRLRSGTISSDGGILGVLSRSFGDGQKSAPDSELESMSFARTLDFTSASVSTTELEIARDYEPIYVAHRGSLDGVQNAPPMRLQLSPEMSVMVSSNEDEGEREEREEERDFMRALGLEFDEIMTRARNESGRM